MAPLFHPHLIRRWLATPGAHVAPINETTAALWKAHVVAERMADQRLDRLLRKELQLPQSLIEKMLRKGQVLINGQRQTDSHARLQTGDEVRLPQRYVLRPLRPPTSSVSVAVSEADRQMLRSSVLYADRDLLVINKPFGIATQGGHRVAKHIDGMLQVFQDKDNPERPKLVHRLDMDTTGCLIVAKSRISAARLQEFIRDPKRMHKTYWAFVVGMPKHSTGRINHPIKRVTSHGIERMVLADPTESSLPTEGLHQPAKSGGGGKEDLYNVSLDDSELHTHHGHKVYKRNIFQAITDYTVMHPMDRGAWLQLEPLTGRKHQLRIHCAGVLQTPIMGDAKYGGDAAARPDSFESILGPGQKPMHLHLRTLKLLGWFRDGSDLVVEAPLPSHMRKTWAEMGLPAPK